MDIKIIMSVLSFLLILSFAFISKEMEFDFMLLSQDRGAACLDGSPPGYYIHEGQGNNRNNFLVYFKGGGFCGQATLQQTLESCYRRSFSDLGSTLNVPSKFDFSTYGVVSPVQMKNPLFFDWTLIVVNYCDGHQYIGHRQNPIEYKNKKLYFRGSRNVKELFYHLSEKYDFYNGGKIIVGGGSAGAICAYQWSNYLVQNTKRAKIYILPDSGFFITDFYSKIQKKKALREQLQPLFSLVLDKAELSQPIQMCIEEPSMDFVSCLNVANYAKYLKAPIFIIESPYDAFGMGQIVKAICFTNSRQPFSMQNCEGLSREQIERYRVQSIQSMHKIKREGPAMGIWGPACIQHSFAHKQISYNNQNYQVKGVTLMEAIRRFLDNPSDSQWLLDERPWPANEGCNGLSRYYQQTI